MLDHDAFVEVGEDGGLVRVGADVKRLEAGALGEIVEAYIIKCRRI